MEHFTWTGLIWSVLGGVLSYITGHKVGKKVGERKK